MFILYMCRSGIRDYRCGSFLWWPVWQQWLWRHLCICRWSLMVAWERTAPQLLLVIEIIMLLFCIRPLLHRKFLKLKFFFESQVTWHPLLALCVWTVFAKFCKIERILLKENFERKISSLKGALWQYSFSIGEPGQRKQCLVRLNQWCEAGRY